MIDKSVQKYENRVNAAAKEIAVGVKAAHQLQGALRAAIVSSGIETIAGTGRLIKTSATAVKDKTTGQLDRIVIKSPRYGFMLNYGFEGIKSNGVAMAYHSRNHLHTAINQTNIINQLANEIGAIRADEVIAHIKF